MSELAVIEGGPANVAPAKLGPVDLLVVARQAEAAKELGRTLIASGFLPDAIKKPEQAVLVILKGQELSLPPVYALSQIAVVSGKPTLSAELMATLVRRAGHTLRIIETTNDECTVEGIRADDKQHHQRVTFTLQDARQAGVGNNPTWKKYPRAMLRSRAVSELCRGMFSDSLGGLSYTPEELGASVDEEGQVVEAEVEPYPSVEKTVSEVQSAVEVDPKPTHNPEHDALCADVQRVYLRIPESERPPWETVISFAEQGVPEARKSLKRMQVLLENAEDAKIVEEYIAESVPEIPEPEPSGYAHDEQIELIEDLVEKLYGEESDVMSGVEWLEDTMLKHPIAALTKTEAKQLIDTMREQLKVREQLKIAEP